LRLHLCGRRRSHHCLLFPTRNKAACTAIGFSGAGISQEIFMKRSFVTIAVAALALSVASPSLAQTVGVGVTIAPEERTRIREYVVQEKVAPVTIREQVRVGVKLPADVELRAVPSAWGPSYAKYRYVYSNNQVYLVEPSSREIVTVID
jgi:hypothetical protein